MPSESVSLGGNSLHSGAKCPKQVSSFQWRADKKIPCQFQATLQTAVPLGHVIQWIQWNLKCRCQMEMLFGGMGPWQAPRGESQHRPL